MWTNLMQSLGMIFVNQALLPYGNGKITAMGIALKISMIGFLSWLDCVWKTAALRLLLRRKELGQIQGDACVCIENDLRYSSGLHDPADEHRTVSFCIFHGGRNCILGRRANAAAAGLYDALRRRRDIGEVLPALVLSIARQGVIFAAVLEGLVHVQGYESILITQGVSDVLTLALALLLVHGLFRDLRDPLGVRDLVSEVCVFW